MAQLSTQRASREILATIAAEVGVSTRTVYRVLNEREGEVWMSAATRGDRIRALAKKLGYRPNLAARSTRTGRFGQVALIMGLGDATSVFTHVFLKGLHDGLAAAEVALIVSRIADELLSNATQLPTILGSLSVDGLLLLYNKQDTPEMQRTLAACGLPLVWVNDRRSQDCVFYDDAQGAGEAVARLHALGHRRIAYLGPSPGRHHSAGDRLDGYRAAMERLQLTAEVIVRPPSNERIPMHDWAETWLRGLADPPGAVICYGTDEALALLLAAGRIGLPVPGRLSLVSCSQDEAMPGGVAFSRMYSEAYDCGRAGAELMLRKLQDPRRRQPVIAMPYVWWERGTTAGPPQA